MKRFEEYFSDKAIIDRLCRIRLKQAFRRHDRLFYRQFSSEVPMIEIDEALDVLPPRRQWNRFRNRNRDTQTGVDQNLIALKRATLALRNSATPPAWAERLQKKIDSIRKQAIHDDRFEFARPTVYGKAKEKKKPEYRPIAKFTCDNQIIDSLTSKYLREAFDSFFSPSSLAFRCTREGKPPPNHNDAIVDICNYRNDHEKTGLYVAECDIRGFYDCVDHAIARNALIELNDEAILKDRSFVLDPRAVLIYEAYLNCYSFPLSVKQESEPSLKKRNPLGYFQWPEAALKKFHPLPYSAEIGVPQGGALSCFIANCVLHYADKEVTGSILSHSAQCLYRRYCDDIVIMSPDLEICKTAYESYRKALKKLLLPAHPAHEWNSYGPQFWEGKTKAPYLWAAPKSSSTVPWIQFVGYQVRYDNLLCIRRKSIEKHMAKITESADKLLKIITPNRPKPGELPVYPRELRKCANAIIHRFRQKLIAKSVGRRKLHFDLGELMPNCWAAGFKQMKGITSDKKALKVLDRHRERQMCRIIRRVRFLQISDKPSQLQKTFHGPRYYGYPFSYVAQFATAPC